MKAAKAIAASGSADSGEPDTLNVPSTNSRSPSAASSWWAAIAFEAFTAHNLPDGLEPNLEAQVTYDPPNFSWPFGTHICVVEVDEETGAVEVVKYVAVDDCGNQINPLIVEGQVHGGVIQGMAQALYEEAVYDGDGNLTTSTLADYDGVRAEQASRRASGGTKHVGIGISSYFEMCGLAPSRVLASLNYGAGGWERATVRVLPTNRCRSSAGPRPTGRATRPRGR